MRTMEHCINIKFAEHCANVTIDSSVVTLSTGVLGFCYCFNKTLQRSMALTVKTDALTIGIALLWKFVFHRCCGKKD